MKKTTTFLIAFLISICSFAQNFEGKIVYTNSVKSKIPNVTDEQFATMMGTTQEYFIKAGDYKSISNGSLFQYQLYINKDNKLYSKMSNSEALLWNDGSENKDEIIKSELNKGVIEILGYNCDELILTCKSGIQKYYFNSKIAVDTKSFTNHKYGNWYEFLLKSNSLPLKIVIDNPQFTLESIATEVKAMKLENTFFDLPENAQLTKSPH